ncbi:MAG: hypothetical protein ABFS34_06150 [Gemmatimonadota bacterium]
MNVAFLPSAYRTIFFGGVAERLEVSGHKVFWISPNLRWARWLRQSGVQPDRILDLAHYGPEWSRQSDSVDAEVILAGLERDGRLTANDILLMDKFLHGRRDRSYALRYLAVCAERIRHFVTAHGVGAVFGEQTWAFELVSGQVCRGLGIPVLNPMTVRIPFDRFAFFRGHQVDQMLRLGTSTAADEHAAAELVSQYRERRPQPSGLFGNREVLEFNAGRLSLLARHVWSLRGDRHDETSRRPMGLISDHAGRWWRRRRNRLMRTAIFEFPDPNGVRPFVLFLLHVQPEATIDVMAARTANQVEIIRGLSRTLPVGYDLYVKEHEPALIWRTMRFYREIKSIPAVRLIDYRVSSLDLIDRAELTITITGTGAYEAAVLGKRAATIGPVFFERIAALKRFDERRMSVGEALNQSAPQSDSVVTDFLAGVLANSWSGIVGDALWSPASMDAGNLDSVAEGFGAAIGALAAPAGEGIWV